MANLDPVAAKALAWDRLFECLAAAAPHPEPTAAVEALLDKVTANHRLREALTWAVGFIRCAHPRAEAEYPDMRNAAGLVADGGAVVTGEFQLAAARAEVAEHLARVLCRLLGLFGRGRVVRVRERYGYGGARRSEARWLAVVPDGPADPDAPVPVVPEFAAAGGAAIPRARFDALYEEDADNPFTTP